MWTKGFVLGLFAAVHLLGTNAIAETVIKDGVVYMDKLPPTPYWCGKIRLKTYLGIYKKNESTEKGPFLELNDGCRWSGKLVSATPLRDAKKIPAQDLDVFYLYTDDCKAAKSGTMVSGIISGLWGHGVDAKRDSGTLKNSTAYFGGCKCPTGKLKNVKIPERCVIDYSKYGDD